MQNDAWADTRSALTERNTGHPVVGGDLVSIQHVLVDGWADLVSAPTERNTGHPDVGGDLVSTLRELELTMEEQTMVDQFIIGFKTQKWWGTLAAIDFFLGGTGAGTFILSMYLGIPSGMLLGWIAVALGAIALLVDLGRPDRFIRAYSQVGRSWISRGVVFTMIFLIFGILRMAPEWLTGLPWGGSTGLGTAIGIVATLGALGVMMYTGLLLSQSPSIPFWNTTLLPLLFTLYGFTCGAGVLLTLSPVLGGSAGSYRSAITVGVALLSTSLAFLWIYVLTMATSTVAARESVRILVKGGLSILFLVGVTVVGLVVPIILTASVYLAGSETATTSAAPVVAGILVLIGGYIFRYSVLKAGVYPPVIDL
jgi:formate-dependent nitrite reductase membrane component NrfD